MLCHPLFYICIISEKKKRINATRYYRESLLEIVFFLDVFKNY